jgi:hypothetical protein
MLRACRSAKPRVAQRWSRAHVGAHHRARRASPRRRQLGFLVPVIAGFALGISAREAALAIVVLAGVLASRLFIGGRGPTGRATLIAGARLHGPGLPITGAGVVGFILGSSMCHEILRAGGSWLHLAPESRLPESATRRESLSADESREWRCPPADLLRQRESPRISDVNDAGCR